jgi:hypothetical protein
MRLAEVRRWLRYSEPEEAAKQLDELLRWVCQGHEEARIMQSAFLDSTLFPGTVQDDLALEALAIAAGSRDLSVAGLMLLDPPPHRCLLDEGRSNVRMRQHMPLGTRKWKARRPDRAMLEKLFTDPDPDVVLTVCSNPRVREADIVSIVSRRPNWSDIIDAVARTHWLHREMVRLSIIQNPYTRTGLAIGLIPQVGPRFLAKFRYASDIHPILAEACDYFLDLWEWRR